MKLTVKVGQVKKTVYKGELEEEYMIKDASVELEFEASEMSEAIEAMKEIVKLELDAKDKVSKTNQHIHGCCKDRSQQTYPTLEEKVFIIRPAEKEDDYTCIRFKQDGVVYEIQSIYSFSTFIDLVTKSHDDLIEEFRVMAENISVYNVDDQDVMHSINLGHRGLVRLYTKVVEDTVRRGYKIKS